MAKTKTKKSEFSIRRVKNKEDRRRPSVFMRLKTDEAFKGFALFEPDPELEENPGYFEYYDHYDKQANQYVPCAGDKCPFCAANDNPSTRALTVWYFPDAGDVKDQIKVFTMNYSTINDITDEAEDEDGILGKQIRIKRLSDKGDYKVKVTSAKALTKAELKKALKALAEKFPESLVALVEKQLKAQMERLKALDALDDDEDEDEEEEEPKSRRGKRAADDDDDDDEDEDDDDDDDEEEEEEDDDEVDEVEEDDDEDDDDDDEEEEEDEEDEEEEEEDSAEISDAEYEVVKANEKDDIFDLKDSDGEKVKMWLGEGVDVDYGEIKKGTKVKVNAATDDEGDWIITAFEIVKPKGGKGGKGKGGKKGKK